jgi:phenylalanyl-tRNA synthetase beta chain
LDTKNVLLESAYFSPASIRKTSRVLNINTDAKYRFERGVDPNSIKEGLELATALIVKICGGSPSKFSIVGSTVQKNKVVTLDIEKFKKVIGITI